MTEFEAKKIYLRNLSGDYLTPIGYSAKFDMDGDEINISELEADQTYDSTSTRAQSGLAVAEAIDSVDINTEVSELGTSGTIALEDNKVYRITPSGSISLVLPSTLDPSKFHQMLVQVNMTTVQTIDVGTNMFFNHIQPDLSDVGVYNLLFEYDNNDNCWVCGLLSKSQAI